jgi:hypothetical protein
MLSIELESGSLLTRKMRQLHSAKFYVAPNGQIEQNALTS